MKNIKQLLLSVIAFSSLLSVANGQELVTSNVSLSDINVLAANKQLTYSNGEPVSMIRTGIIKNSKGLVARGPHKFIFTLDADSPYSVILRDEVVTPGESLEFVENITQLGGRLSIPIYPAQAGISGEASYSLDIPKLFARACKIGFEEDTVDCFKTIYSELLYKCPIDNTEYREDTNDCRGIVQQASELECDEPFTLVNGLCVQEFVPTEDNECPTEEGWAMAGTMCRYYKSPTILPCTDGGELVQGGAVCEISLQSEAVFECKDPTSTPDLENGRCVIVERAPFLQAEFVKE